MVKGDKSWNIQRRPKTCRRDEGKFRGDQANLQTLLCEPKKSTNVLIIIFYVTAKFIQSIKKSYLLALLFLLDVVQQRLLYHFGVILLVEGCVVSPIAKNGNFRQPPLRALIKEAREFSGAQC